MQLMDVFLISKVWNIIHVFAVVDATPSLPVAPLLTWVDFNPSMDK